MNKKTFEDWLNKENLNYILSFFTDKESKALTDSLITEHGQEYFDATISNFINTKLEEMIINPKNKEGIYPKGFYPLADCFFINDEISSNIASRFYELCIKHCANDFEKRSEKLIHKDDKPNIPDSSFVYIFEIIKNKRQYFNEQQIQALFDGVVDVIDKRGTVEARSNLIGIKLSEISGLANIVCNNPFLNTENLQRVVLEKPIMRCSGEKSSKHINVNEVTLLFFAQSLNVDANPYVEKLIKENEKIEWMALEFLGFGGLSPSTQKFFDARYFKHLRPLENLKAELKEYCRDQLLLQQPNIYTKLVELEQAELSELELKQQNNKQSKFSKIKSSFKHGFEKSL